MENKTENCKKEPIHRGFSIKKYISLGLFITLGCLLGFLHYNYVSNLFINDRNFHYLSALEREMSLRTEMGFYYSYYKTIVEEKPFVVGLSKLMYDRLVEYPKDVNAFNRFNIHPEVIIGALYRYLEPWFNATGQRQCYIVDRGDDLPPVESCLGLGEPIYFYLENIWWLAGVTVSTLFFFATTLSGTVVGGLLAVVQYFANHAECTRVMWTPNERENLAQPFLLLQMWLITIQLRQPLEMKATLGLQVSIFFVNCICLLFWQFTQFIFLTQTAIFFVMEQLHIIDLKSFCIFLHAHFCGLHTAILLLQGNDMLKSSIYSSFFLVVSAYSLFFSSLRIKVQSRLDLFVEAWLVLLRIGIVIFASLWLRKVLSQFLDVQEDSHIFEILYSKFTNFRNFHTMLYTCSAVFDFLPAEVFYQLTLTGLLPFVVVGVSNVLYYWLFNAIVKFKSDSRQPVVKKKDGDGNESSGEDSGIENNMADKRKCEERKRRGRDVEYTDLDAIDASIDKGSGASENDCSDTDPQDSWVVFLRSLDVDPGIFYNIAQMCVFGFMAVIIMRLKLLFTPHLCLISSLVVNPKYYSRIIMAHKKHFLVLVIAVICCCIVNGKRNITKEMSYIGSFSDPAAEALVAWARAAAAAGVFAGPMPLTALLLLAARRAVVNHPHYEHADARQRNYAVYKTYGKFSPLELYNELTKYKVTHLIVDRTYCYSRSSRGCTFEEIWDVEAPALRARPRLCHTLLTEDTDHFYPVYDNEQYAVFKLHDYSVRYVPRVYDT